MVLLVLASTNGWSASTEASTDRGTFAFGLRLPRPAPPPSERVDDLRVLWIDVQDRVPFLFDAATAEAASALASEGVRITFRKASAGAAEGASDLRIILLSRSQATPTVGPLVMGAVHPVQLRRGESRAVWVYLEPVLKALGLRSVAEHPHDVARALGRVIAHELIHTMVPQLEHARHGLMAPTLTTRELGGATVEIDSAFRRALRRTDARPLLASPLQRGVVRHAAPE